MNKQVLKFMIVSIVILCFGYVIFSIFIQNEDGNQGDDSLATSTKTAQTLNKINAQGTQEGQANSGIDKMVVLSTIGTVEKRSTLSRKWVPVVTGDELLAKDAIKTEENSSARFAANDKSELELQPHSELSLDDLSSSGHAVNLKRGQLRVDYKKHKNRTIRVSAKESGSVAESESGSFVLQNQAGNVSLAATEGEVKLTSNKKTVVVGAGQYSSASQGRQPSQVAPIPIEVMLKVARLNRKMRNVRNTVVRGQADPGALVHVNGIEAQSSYDGSFEATVPLAPGKNQVRVVTRTPWGSKKKTIPVISVRKLGRVEEAAVRWGHGPDTE